VHRTDYCHNRGRITAPGSGKIPALAEESARLEAKAGTGVAVLVEEEAAADDELEAMAVTAGRRRKS
jgi:hypothetical protein